MGVHARWHPMIAALRSAVSLPLLASMLLGSVPMRAENSGLDLTKIPVPPGARRIHADAYSAIYSIDAPADSMREASAKLLAAQGWEPYGSAGLTRYYKRGTTRLLTTIQPEAGKPDRTMITFSGEAMSADIPLPPGTEEVQYTDSAKRLGFLTALSPEGVTEFYRKALAPTGWFTKMPKPEKTDFQYEFIFRSPADEMILINMTPTSGKLRTMVTYSTAEEVAAEKQRVATGMAALKDKLAREASAPKPKVTISLPTGTQSKALTKQDLKLNLPAGKAKSAVESLRDELLASGWKETNASLDPAGGTVNLSRESHSLTILYMDPGFMPAEITVTPLGVEIDLTEAVSKK